MSASQSQPGYDECALASANAEPSAARPAMVCPACGGEGGGIAVYSAPGTLDGTRSEEWTCRACDGSGEVEDYSEPLDELSAIERDAALAAMGEPEDSLMLGGCGGGERDPDLEWC